MRSPLEHRNDWYDLLEIAEKAPLEFLEAVWPWFVEQCEEHHSGKPSPDGGVDQRLLKAGAKTLVQCKHWKERRVGVTVVRELLGVVTFEGAQSGIVVTSGKFTSEAIAFADKAPIRLIDGRELIKLISGVQASGRITSAATQTAATSPVQTQSSSNPDQVKCPKCGAEMVRRIAKTGQYAGSPFLGCSRYPACRGIRNLATSNS